MGLYENSPYYITAYGLAVKRGFVGTMDEWLASLVGPQGIQGLRGEKGADGKGFAILGYYDTAEELQAAQRAPEPGDAYGVGTEKPYDVYIWDAVKAAWVDNGPIQGEQGPAGADATINGEYAITLSAGGSAHIEQTDADVKVVTPNPNLLINAHFDSAHLIDQRQGYIVLTGTQFYNDTACTDPDVTASTNIAATYVNDTYGIIKTGTEQQLTRYVKFSDMVRGYVGAGYTVDMWKITEGLTIEPQTDGVKIINMSAAAGFTSCWRQTIEAGAFKGKTLCFSLLSNSDNTFAMRFRFADSSGGFLGNITTLIDSAMTSVTAEVPTDAVYIQVDVANSGSSPVNAEIVVYAAKLEIGDTQTLARQDADGNWVLIDQPPKPAAALAECWRYFRRWSGQYAAIGTGFFRTDSTAVIVVPASVPPRIGCVDDTGAIKLHGTIYLVSANGIGPNSIAATTIDDASINPNAGMMFLAVSGFTGGVAGQGLVVQFRDAASYIEYDANL